ncbi:hypothetical protein Ancab_005162 [Ancistrocladus abbreviatus]
MIEELIPHWLRRAAIPSSQALSLLGRDLREAHLQVLLGGSGFRSNTTTAANTVTDPFLSSLVLNFVGSEADEFSKSMGSSTEDSSAKNATSARLWKPRHHFILDHRSGLEAHRGIVEFSPLSLLPAVAA